MNFGNLGVALGAGVDEYHRQQEEARKQTAEARADTQFKQQQAQYERQMKQQQAMDAVNAKYAGYREAMKKGDFSFADSLMNEYNANVGPFADGVSVYNQSTPQGRVAHFVGQDGKPVRSVPINVQTMAQMLDDAHMAEMKYASPEMFQNSYYKDRTHALDLRKTGADEVRAGAAKQQADTMEGYRGDQRRLIDEQIRTGNWGAVDLNKAHAGYYGRMPRDGGGGGALAKDPMKGLIGFDEKTGAVFRMNQNGSITSEVLRDEAGNPVPTAIIKGLFRGGHNQEPKPVPQVNPKILESALVQWEGRPQKSSDQGAWDARFDSMYPGMRGYIMSGGSSFVPGSGGLTLDLRGDNGNAAPPAPEAPSVNASAYAPSQTSREARGLRLPSASAPLSTANFSPVTQRRNAIAEQQLRAKYGPNWEAVLGAK